MADDRETLVSLLKDKAKENKQLNKKNKKLEEKYVELHKKEKGLLKDRETFISFLHLVFPQQHLDELLLPDTEYGLYDIEHLKQFWTHLKSQTDNESVHIIHIMKEEKQVLYQKIQQYERDLADKDELSKRLQEMEIQLSKVMQDLDKANSIIQDKDTQLEEYALKLSHQQSHNERARDLERELSELKAAQLMTMFGGSNSSQSIRQNKQAERQVETLKVQLSEKTNDYLRLKEENEELRDQLQSLQEKYANEPSVLEVHVDNMCSLEQERVQSNNNSILEQSLEMDDPKYRNLEQQLREKEEETEKLTLHTQDLEVKLQKLLTEFSQFRNKAQQMLASKEDEIERVKGRKQSPGTLAKNELVEDLTPRSTNAVATLAQQQPMDQVNTDYVKNVFIKYLEYQANGNEKEALTLEKVLFTVLKAADKDVEPVEKARAKNLQGGLFSYFYQQQTSLVARPVQPRQTEVKNQVVAQQNNNGYLDTKVNFTETQNQSSAPVVIDNRKYFNINIS